MPILPVKVSARSAREASARIAATLVEPTTTILGQDPKLISVAIDDVDRDHWHVGGRSLHEQGKTSVCVAIARPTKRTRSPRRGATSAAVFAASRQLLGDFYAESYHVHDVRAAAYGHGGRRRNTATSMAALPFRRSPDRLDLRRRGFNVRAGIRCFGFERAYRTRAVG